MGRNTGRDGAPAGEPNALSTAGEILIAVAVLDALAVVAVLFGLWRWRLARRKSTTVLLVWCAFMLLWRGVASVAWALREEVLLFGENLWLIVHFAPAFWFYMGMLQLQFAAIRILAGRAGEVGSATPLLAPTSDVNTRNRHTNYIRATLLFQTIVALCLLAMLVSVFYTSGSDDDSPPPWAHWDNMEYMTASLGLVVLIVMGTVYIRLLHVLLKQAAARMASHAAMEGGSNELHEEKASIPLLLRGMLLLWMAAGAVHVLYLFLAVVTEFDSDPDSVTFLIMMPLTLLAGEIAPVVVLLRFIYVAHQHQRAHKVRNAGYEEGMAESNMCSICCEHERTVMFTPCSHVTACRDCAEMMNECPLCRSTIVEKVRVHIQ